jgi:hypothetical protein
MWARALGRMMAEAFKAWELLWPVLATKVRQERHGIRRKSIYELSFAGKST